MLVQRFVAVLGNYLAVRCGAVDEVNPVTEVMFRIVMLVAAAPARQGGALYGRCVRRPAYCRGDAQVQVRVVTDSTYSQLVLGYITKDLWLVAVVGWVTRVM
jgi:hypothetical protein